jgi:hypothetical protein
MKVLNFMLIKIRLSLKTGSNHLSGLRGKPGGVP